MVYDKSDFKVGGKVIVLNYEDLTRHKKWTKYEAIVTKIGRVYVHVVLAGDWNIKLCLETGLSDGSRYMVFPTMNTYIDFHNTYRLRPVIKRAFEKQYKALTFDKLKQLSEILDVDWRSVLPEEVR